MITKTKTKKLNLFSFKNSDINKQILIKMAKEGKDRPASLTRYGRLLYSYTCKSLTSYDESFDKQIRKIRPDWFIKSSEIMKQKLIKMAKEGKDRPKQTTKEGRALERYLNKKSSSYDESFDKQIRKIRPDWFIKSSEIMKQKLIKMAKEGKSRPKKNTKEGRALERYIHKTSSYCDSFVKTIKSLAPNWFKEKRTSEEKILKVIKENPGINASGLYAATFGNINSNNLKKSLEKLRQENLIHFKLTNLKNNKYSQKWYSSPQTKEKKEISDIWVKIQDIQEEIQRCFNKKNSLAKIKKMINNKFKLSK